MALVLGYFALGLCEWLVLVAALAGSDSSPSTDLYFVLVLVSAFVLGWLDERSSHLLAGIALVLPALLTAGWTMPRSDTDGLWILIYPLLVILAGTAFFCTGSGEPFDGDGPKRPRSPGM